MKQAFNSYHHQPPSQPCPLVYLDPRLREDGTKWLPSCSTIPIKYSWDLLAPISALKVPKIPGTRLRRIGKVEIKLSFPLDFLPFWLKLLLSLT